MCGIVAYWDKQAGDNATLGATILRMLNALGSRGPDSAGVALYGNATADQLVVRVKSGEPPVPPQRVQELRELVQRHGGSDFSQQDVYLRFGLPASAGLPEFLTAAESIGDDVEVVSAGSRLEVVKQVGSPQNLERTFAISQTRGSHGIGHTRLSTESAVDLSHSQPFWAHGCPDLAVVHNGHITNYHKLRRQYEQRGVRFYTENDSEIIGIYLGERLVDGATLEEALRSMLVDLDGSFCCLAATATQLGMVKDPFCLKPLVITDNDEFVAIATEQVAIHAAVGERADVRETQAGEVRVWRV